MKILLTTILLAIANFLFCQIETVTIDLDADKYVGPTEWVTYYEDEIVLIQYKFQDCYPSMGYDDEKVLLKFANKTKLDVALNWNMVLSYDGICKTCDMTDEYYFGVMLTSLESKEGSCDHYGDNNLKMFSRFKDEGYKGKPTRLSAFKLANLEVRTTNQ